ncbi:MAG: hypothetical protein KAG66_22770, partial [Methylococcales bacterium]|nr:hypothetical protein [Methylococcales bacterium]
MAGRIILFVGLMLMLAACQPEEGVVEGVTAVSPSPIPLPTATVPPPQIVTQVVAEKETAVSPATNTPTPETELDFRYLNAVITQSLADFDGLYSIYVQELHSGETLEIDSNLAIAGMSLLKIPILVETYRALDQPPNIEQNKLISDTLGIQSGNYTANLLLQEVAGQPNTFIGADILTQSMKDIGLFNTFIAVPYGAEPRPGRLLTYLTPANQRTDRTTFPDPYRQTTTGDLGQLLTMIYECATEDNGQLRDVYADTITQTECQEMLA